MGAARDRPDNYRMVRTIGGEHGEIVEVARLPLPAYIWKEVEGALRLVDFNEAARTLEPAIDELMGMTGAELQEASPEIAAHVLHALEHQTVVTAEGSYRRRSDGSVRWLSATFAYAPPATVIMHVDDLTERRREDRLIRDANQRFRGAFESSPLGQALISADPDDAGRIIEVNDAFCDLFHYEREQLLGHIVPAELSHPDDVQVGLELIARLVAGEIDSCHFEKRFVRSDGHVLAAGVWVTLIDGAEVGSRYVLCHFQDVTHRNESETALRESEERYRQIVETTSEGVWTIDAASRTTFVNARMAEMLGYSIEEMLGRPVDEFVVGPTPDIAAQLERRRPGAVQQPETQLRRRDGSSLWVSLSNDSLPSHDGEYVGALAMVSDITERKQAEAEFGMVTARFEGAFDHAPNGMALVSLSETNFGELLRVNSALCDLLGYEASDLLGGTFSDITHPDDVEADVALARRLVGGQITSYQTDKRYLTATGDVVLATLSASLIPNGDGGPAYGIAHVQDVTARRRAEEEVEERERRFRAAFSLALDAMLIFDDDRRWVQGNRAAAELLGIEQEEIAGKPSQELSEGNRGMSEEDWRRFLAEGEMKGEADIRRADGGLRHVEFSARANFMPGRHLSILRDVTERKQAEEARERARVEAERLESALHQAQKLDTVGQLAGGVAHDFNNLLSVIMHASEFALSTLDGHPAAEEVREISAAAERAAALTRQLLVFSRREIAQPRLLDLNAVVASVERLLRRTIGEHIVLEAELDACCPSVYADPNHLEQVLLNLAVNARDAMPEGGTLRVQTSTVEIDEDYARLHADLEPGRYVRLAVSDTGTGMPEHVRQRAFEPFFTTKPKGTGTGLGLATTYGIVKQNGGHIEIYSEPDEGTVMKVYLPASAGEAEERPLHKPPTARRGRGERVLVVEDEEGVRRLTERILREHGYEVMAAAGADEAIDLAESTAIDLVLTDVVMPGMSGGSLLGRLREHRRRLPAIFMSGYTDRPGALPADAAFLSKPFSRQHLLESVARALE
jgi:two-component system, cell cycle sensor histidine kinase and response regulator CckA